LAHALATRLQAEDAMVSLLVLLDAYPPLDTVCQAGAPVRLSGTDRQMLTSVLATLGVTLPRQIDASLDQQTLLAELVRQEALCASDHETAVHMLDAFKRSPALLRTFVPRRFEGDVLFLRATQTSGLSSAPDPQRWEPHVSGNIELHDLDADHFRLLEPRLRPKIGELLTSRLLATDHPRRRASGWQSASMA